MHLVLCGTGSGAPDPNRAGPCTAIVAGGRLFLVDVGSGAWERADLTGLPIESLRGVLLTKLLADDFADLGEAMTRSWIVGREDRLAVYGPAGTARLVKSLVQAYQLDVALRLAHHDPAVLRPERVAAEGHDVALSATADSAVVFDEDGLRVTAFAVGKSAEIPSVGYRLDYRGRSIVIAGHSRGHPNVVKFARGVDILVHEATNHEMVERGIVAMDRLGMDRSAALWREMLRTHTTPVEAAETARQAGVGLLVISRVMPPLRGFIEGFVYLAGVRDVFPRVVLGEDGMRFRLDPAD